MYEHYGRPPKKVIWVLAGKDQTDSLDGDDDVPQWQRIIDENNEYLRQNFRVDGHPDQRFIGEGFIAVSAADEARAAWFRRKGDNYNAESYQSSSNMDALRQRLNDLIEHESGPRHVAEIAEKAHGVVGPLANVVRQRLLEEKIDVDQIKDRLAEIERALDKADMAIPRMRNDLEERQRSRVQTAAQPFSRLARHLHTQLDDEIRRTDLREKRPANAIEVLRANVVQKWLEAPGGPAELWDQQLKQFRQDIDGWMRRSLHDGRHVATALEAAKFNVDDYNVSPQKKRRMAPHDIVQRTAAVLGISAPVAATATWIGSTVAAGVLIPPAGAVVGAAALVIMGVQLFKRNQDTLGEMQAEWIADLNDLAVRVEEQFRLALGSQLQNLIYGTEMALEGYRTTLTEEASRLAERKADPEFQILQETVDRLSHLSQEGTEIAEVLEGLAAAGGRAARFSPN